MKFILAACLLFFSFSAPAQITAATLELLQQTMELFDKGEYEKTIMVAEKAAVSVKKDVGESDPFYGGPIFFLAVCHYRLYQYEKAETYFIKQKELLSKTSGEKDKSYTACLINLAALYRDMGKYPEAETLYIQANAINKMILGENDPDYYTSINNLASLYHLIGQYEKAEEFFTVALNNLKTFFRISSTRSKTVFAFSYNPMSEYNVPRLLRLVA